MKYMVFTILFLNALSVFALTSINDDDMATVIGQSGITIENKSHGSSSIGEIRFEDSDGSQDFHASGNKGSLSLRSVEISDTSLALDIDVSESGVMIWKLKEFAQTDFLVNDLSFNHNASLASFDFSEKSTPEQLQQYYNSIGSFAINDFTVADDADISFKFGSDAAGQASLSFSSHLSIGSYFHFTYTDDGEFTFDPNGDGDTSDNSGKNYISAKFTFNTFKVKDISFHGKEVGAESYLELTLASLSGGVAFENITINNKVLGTMGMENLIVDPVSYFRIQGK